MAYPATIIPVMIASPGDVNDERAEVRHALHDWNDVNSVSAKVMLAPIGWDSHSSPELGSRPQELINRRLLERCDLLIGVFWTRIGSPTGVAESGTVEEIKEHLAAGKPAMIYFCRKPVAPDALDAEQYAKLKEFEAWCKTQGLIEEFVNLDEFRRKLHRQLTACLSNNSYLRSLTQPDSGAITVSVQASQANDAQYQLSDDAIALLKAAASREDGTILKLATLGGRFIQTGGQNFGGGHGRESAKWENALNELLENNLVVERGYKGEYFELTHEGWRVADAL
jgi:hypothetical protein